MIVRDGNFGGKASIKRPTQSGGSKLKGMSLKTQTPKKKGKCKC